MKTFLKWLAVIFVGLLLVLLAGLATVGWWLPPLAERGARNLLESLGFEAVQISVERLGYSGVTIGGLAFEREDAEVTLKSVRLDYSLNGLIFHQQAESLLINGLEVTVFADRMLKTIRQSAAEGDEDANEALSLPQGFKNPLKDVLLENSALTVEADGWRKRLELFAYLLDGNPTSFLIQASDADDELSVSGKLNTKNLDTDAVFRLQSSNSQSWWKIITALELFEAPEGLDWSLGKMEIEGAVQTASAIPEKWTLIGSMNQLLASIQDNRISVEQINFGANGDGMIPDKVWAGLFDTETTGPIKASWEAATFETLDTNQVYIKLEGWEVDADLSEKDLGNINGSAGPVRVLLEGPWQELRSEKDLQPFKLKMMMPESPLAIFTTMASITANAELRIDLDAADPERSADLQATLSDAIINTDKVELGAEQVEVNIEGLVPASLSSVIQINNASATWAEGAGTLTGINGELTVTQLLPFKLPGPQKLTFERLEQGKVVIDNGEVTILYQKESEDVPLVMTVTAGGNFAGGKLAGRVKVTLGDPVRTEADLLMQRVDLSELAALFPQFQGKIQGKVSGEVPIHLVGKRVFLQPGYLEMAACETGKVSYLRQGWLTQDPGLDPLAVAEDKDLVTLMKEPNGAAILTELAMRDLNMTEFRLEILEPDGGRRKAVIHIEGDGTFKGVTVPVVQDININEDLNETINLILEMNEKFAF